LKYFPVAIRVKDTDVLVVGGGLIGQRKILSLLKCSAKVILVSPEVTPVLARLAGVKKITWFKRKFIRKDVSKAKIVFAATNDLKVNKKISLWANKKGTLVNIADNENLSNFISPAVLRKGRAVIAVNSDGREPELSRDLKYFLKENWNEFLSYRSKLQERNS